MDMQPPPAIIQHQPAKPIYEVMPGGTVRIIYCPPTTVRRT